VPLAVAAVAVPPAPKVVSVESTATATNSTLVVRQERPRNLLVNERIELFCFLPGWAPRPKFRWIRGTPVRMLAQTLLS
jgi:hypothetical protein